MVQKREEPNLCTYRAGFPWTVSNWKSVDHINQTNSTTGLRIRYVSEEQAKNRTLHLQDNRWADSKKNVAIYAITTDGASRRLATETKIAMEELIKAAHRWYGTTIPQKTPYTPLAQKPGKLKRSGRQNLRIRCRHRLVRCTDIWSNFIPLQSSPKVGKCRCGGKVMSPANAW
jgi:hypothetical protein